YVDDSVVCVCALALDHLQTTLPPQRRDVGGRQVAERDVDVATLDGQLQRRRVLVVLDQTASVLGGRSPVSVVALEHSLTAGLILDQLVWAAADRLVV